MQAKCWIIVICILYVILEYVDCCGMHHKWHPPSRPPRPRPPRPRPPRPRPPPPPPPCCCCCNSGWTGSESGWPPDEGCSSQGGMWGHHRSEMLQREIPTAEGVPLLEVPDEPKPKYLATVATADEKPICTGTIVSAHFVLTPCMRCLRDNGTAVHPERIRVLLLDDASPDSRFVVYDAQSVTIHPQCHRTENLKHDIALVQTADAIKMSEYIHPAMLPNSLEPKQDQTWILSSYNAKRESTNGESAAVEYAKVVSVDPETCKKVLNSSYYDESVNYCTPYDHNGRKDTCWDDFGAPLSRHNTVYGLLIHKYHCGKEGSVGSFVSIPLNSHWIQNTIAQLTGNTEKV